MFVYRGCAVRLDIDMQVLVVRSFFPDFSSIVASLDYYQVSIVTK